MNDQDIINKIAELRQKMRKMDCDFETMQELQSKIEVLKELIDDENHDDIEDNWFDLYGEELKRRIRHES